MISEKSVQSEVNIRDTSSRLYSRRRFVERAVLKFSQNTGLVVNICSFKVEKIHSFTGALKITLLKLFHAKPR